MRQYLREIGYTVVAFTLAALVSPCTVVSQDLSVKKPEISIAQDWYSFESVPEGSKIVHDFKLKNSGNADLVVQKVIPSCGCTASKVQPETIPPGTEAILHVELDTSGFAGDKVKTVRILTNDVDHPSSTFTLRGNIEPSVSVDPQRISFDSLTRGSDGPSATKEFSVSIRPGSENKLGVVRSFSKSLQVRELSGDVRMKRIAVTISPDAPVGELRERILVEITGGRNRSISVPVYASITGELSVVPSSISMGLIEGTQLIERSVKFDNSGKGDVAIKEIQSDNPALSAAAVEIQKGRHYVIKVRLNPALIKRDEDFRAVVTVVTDRDPLPITVYGTVPPKME